MNGWINVKDRFPYDQDSEDECNEYVFVSIEGFGVYKAMYMDGSFWFNYISKVIGNVTHWMLFPEVPKEKK